jgi:hypothetical protein
MDTIKTIGKLLENMTEEEYLLTFGLIGRFSPNDAKYVNNMAVGEVEGEPRYVVYAGDQEIGAIPEGDLDESVLEQENLDETNLRGLLSTLSNQEKAEGIIAELSEETDLRKVALGSSSVYTEPKKTDYEVQGGAPTLI